MFTNLSWGGFLTGLAVLTVIYYLILAGRNKRKALAFAQTQPGQENHKLNISATKDFPQLIDKPVTHPSQEMELEIELKQESEYEMEMLKDEESVLLKEAENVVAKIQDTINHVASNPPNKEEVFSKLRAIVSQYTLFENTEYYDAINNFIAITVQRDCTIEFSKEQLQALWN